MKVFVKWGLIVLILGAVILIVLRYLQCNRRGKESGQPYQCKILCSDPDWMQTEKEYFTMREGKCYKVYDYGDNMSIRRVGLENCGEKEIPKASSVEDAIYI